MQDHELTPACWAALGKRGLTGAMAKARAMYPRVREGTSSGSSNIHLILALNNAAVHGDYARLLDWLDDMRVFGSGEGGPLYGPAGNGGYANAAAALSHLDGRRDVEQQALEYAAWWRDYSSEIAVPRPANVVTIGPDGKRHDSLDRPPAGGPGVKHVLWNGDRVLFSHSMVPGWYEEGIATSLYNWLIGAPGRELAPRFANYSPTTINTWDSWAWLICVLRGWIPAKSWAQPEAVQKAYREHSLAETLEGVSPGPYRVKWGTEVVRFNDGSMFYTTSHATASPKPPASVIERMRDGLLKIYIPDGWTNYGDDGRGTVHYTGSTVWAEATAESTGAELKTAVRPRWAVVSHRVIAAKGVTWKNGVLHPAQPVPPPSPEPEPPSEKPEQDRRWYDYPGLWLTKLWRWIEGRI